MRRPLLVLMLASLLLAALPPAALGTTTKIEFMVTETNVVVKTAGVPALNGSVYSLRGQVNTEDIHLVTAAGASLSIGALVSAQETAVNYDLDLATGVGDLWGTATNVPVGVTDGGYSCTWHGRFLPSTYNAATFSALWVGKNVCHGYGSLAGVQSRADVVLRPNGMVLSTVQSFVPGDKS